MKRLQITMSPYYGSPDFSRLTDTKAYRQRLDLVSVADLLRNGFVYPPHSIFEDVKLATFGFDPGNDLHDDPEFRFEFRESDKRREPGESDDGLVNTYHRLLCEAVDNACTDMRSPWLLQSGGKDSTPLAIAASEVRPDTVCITYLGGQEENEVASARFVATKLGLRHEALVCNPGRAYDRYLSLLGRMPLLTADFALLSYIDLAATVAEGRGDGIIDGMGSDNYFGTPVDRQHRLLGGLAKDVQLPPFMVQLPLIRSNFKLCYLLSTLQMNRVERVFPGSRFTDAEVDELLGREVSRLSRARLALFREELESASSPDEHCAMALTVAGGTGGFAKGLFTANALQLRAAYPFCDYRLREWVYRQVPANHHVDPVTHTSKVLVRKHIARRFGNDLPYVTRKGSFRFDLCGLARQRYEQVHAYAVRTRDLFPGAVRWLERNRGVLDNKYHASKFFLLAVVLPWIDHHAEEG